MKIGVGKKATKKGGERQSKPNRIKRATAEKVKTLEANAIKRGDSVIARDSKA